MKFIFHFPCFHEPFQLPVYWKYQANLAIGAEFMGGQVTQISAAHPLTLNILLFARAGDRSPPPT